MSAPPPYDPYRPSSDRPQVPPPPSYAAAEHGDRPGDDPYGTDRQAPAGTPAPPAPPAPSAAPARRRPTWPSLLATAVGAAVLASGATAALTAADDDDEVVPVSAAADREDDDDDEADEAGEAGDEADPVVTATATVPDWVDLAATVGPTVVAIDVRTAGGPGAGSGVVVAEDGRIVTNDHVVGDAVEGGIVVTLSDGRMFEADVVGTDPSTDLAVIALEDPPDDLRAAVLTDSDAVRVGDPVAAIGNPLGLSNTVTTGIVSALDRPVTTAQATQDPGQPSLPVTTNAIQVDAPINPGNSGGPLFDAQGRVIGINSSIASLPGGAGGVAGSIGLGFAIPSNLVELIAAQLVEDGVAEHAYLGVTPDNAVAPVGDEMRSGAQVQTVEPGSPADRAGLRPGDVVLRVDDDPVTGAESLIGVIRQHASGDEVRVFVARDGEPLEVTATLATREDVLP